MAGNIFETDSDLNVDFSQYEIDLRDRALQRLLYQFGNSVTLGQLVESLAFMEQDGYDDALGVLTDRTLTRARGVQLDVIGRIVGQDRVLRNYALRTWFGPDGGTQIGGVDLAPVWMREVPLLGDLPADDSQYIGLILSKIFKNHVKVGSIPELILFAKALTGHDISVNRIGPLEIELAVPSSIFIGDLSLLLDVLTDHTADQKYTMPVMASVRISDSVLFLPSPVFTPDIGNAGADVGKVAVRAAQ